MSYAYIFAYFRANIQYEKMQHLLTSERIGEVDGDGSSNVEKYAEEDDNED